MDTRNPYVIDVLDGVSHHFSGDNSLFGDGDVAGSGGNNCDHALAIAFAVALEHDGSGQRTIFDFVHVCRDSGKLRFVSTGGKHISAVRGKARKDVRDLLWRLALAENDFRHSLAENPVMVHLGETEILEGEVSEPVNGMVGGQAAAADVVEKLAEGTGVHEIAEVGCRGPRMLSDQL